jgi:hypothetical protein
MSTQEELAKFAALAREAVRGRHHKPEDRPWKEIEADMIRLDCLIGVIGVVDGWAFWRGYTEEGAIIKSAPVIDATEY